jgi:hypothetical protein
VSITTGAPTSVPSLATRCVFPHTGIHDLAHQIPEASFRAVARQPDFRALRGDAPAHAPRAVEPQPKKLNGPVERAQASQDETVTGRDSRPRTRNGAHDDAHAELTSDRRWRPTSRTPSFRTTCVRAWASGQLHPRSTRRTSSCTRAGRCDARPSRRNCAS